MTYFRRWLITLSAVSLLALVMPFGELAAAGPARPELRISRRSELEYGAGCASGYALNAAVRRLAYRSQSFEWQLERELNRSYLDGTPGEKRANQLGDRFHKAAENLRSAYAVGRTVDNSRVEAFHLLRLGSELGEFVAQAPVSRTTFKSWDAIDRELSLLATVYDFDAAGGDNPDSQGEADNPVEYHSAAGSYSRIWRWPF